MLYLLTAVKYKGRTENTFWIKILWVSNSIKRIIFASFNCIQSKIEVALDTEGTYPYDKFKGTKKYTTKILCSYSKITCEILDI